MPGKPSIEAGDGSVIIRLRLQPNASSNAIQRSADGEIRVRVTAPPIEGAANKALRALVAKTFGVSKGAVLLLHGDRSRDKTIELRGASESAVRAKLDCL